MKMPNSNRIKIILEILNSANKPISATALGSQLSVSRQIIVGDIALLRAMGESIISTPRGYTIELPCEKEHIIACKHTDIEQMKDELYTIVDHECGILDVTIDHAIYGQISGKLHIYTRADVDEFIQLLDEHSALPISNLTDNIHTHTLNCLSDKHFEDVKAALAKKGILRY